MAKQESLKRIAEMKANPEMQISEEDFFKFLDKDEQAQNTFSPGALPDMREALHGLGKRFVEDVRKTVASISKIDCYNFGISSCLQISSQSCLSNVG